MSAPSSKDGATSVVTTGVSEKLKVLQEKQSFTWIIENFEMVRMSDELISGQKFQFEAGDAIGRPTTWQFYLNYCDVGEREPKTKWISLFLKLLKTPEDVKKVTAGFGIECKHADGRAYFKSNVTPRMFDTGSGASLGWTEFIKRDAMLRDLPLGNGSLIIKAEFTLCAVKSAHRVQMDIFTQQKEFETKAIQKLIADLGKSPALTGSNVDSVTKLVSKDNVGFPVNRGILSARSLVFQSMFRCGMREATTGVVRMDDLSGKTIGVLLHYLTTGMLREGWNSPEVIMELPYAAQKYDLKLLVDFLDNVLGRVCTVGNAKQLADLANKLGMKKAERDLLAFIKEKATGRK